jgi:hypothetical protein
MATVTLNFMNALLEQTKSEAPTREEIITANCPTCGEPFEIPLELLDYFAKHGCACCQSQENNQ